MSNLSVSKLSGPANQNYQVRMQSGHTLVSPGSVIQFKTTELTVATAVAIPASYTTLTDIPDFNVVITPKLTTSKIFVQVRWFGEWSNQTANWDSMFGLKRNGTSIGANSTTGAAQGISMASLCYYSNDGSSTPEVMYFDYYDTPNSTSALTYQVFACTTNGNTLYTNRTVTAGGSGLESGTSRITVWEIAQ